MIFVIEGPDGCGKSTLISAIRAQYKKRNVHFLAVSGQPASAQDIQDEIDWVHSVPQSMLLFCDRYRLISEPIYGHLLRRKDLSEGIHPSFPQLITFVYCRPPLKNIEANVMNSKQLEGVPDNLIKIVNAYDYMFHHIEGQMPIHRFDYTKDGFEKIERIIDNAQIRIRQ